MFSPRHFGDWNNSVICSIVVLKFAITPFISLYFWPNWLNFFWPLKKNFNLWPKYDRKKSSVRVSWVVWGGHFRLLVLWAKRLHLQWMLPRWQANCNTARELFLYNHASTLSMRPDKYRFSNLCYDPTCNQNQPTSFCGTCSTNY